MIVTNAKILFSAESDYADALVEVFEDMDLEVDTEDSKDYIAIMENNYDISSVEEMVDFIRPIIDEYDVNLYVRGTLLDQRKEEYIDYEIQYKNGNLRYRETDPYVNEEIADLTYDEYEEEGHHNLSEEDFMSHIQGNAEGRVVNTRGKFSKWISIS